MLVAEQLTEDHDTSVFACGEPALDHWLRTQALTAQKKGTGRVYVLLEADDPTDASAGVPALPGGSGDGEGTGGTGRRVLAYYTLSAHLIEREQLSGKLARGMPAQLPAVLMGKLAVDATRHGTGLGGQVLAEAITRVLALSEQVGFRYLIVDALHEEAAAFYEHYGFARVPTTTSLRLVLRVRATLLDT